jgi:hypothetical protein
VIQSQKVIHEKEMENIELRKRLEKVEESISMYFSDKESKCQCAVL